MLGGLARPAHAQSTLSVTDCSSDAQLQAAVAQANSDNAGDVITFACSGDILLTSTLTINGSMTLDGSGQSVTLDGGNSVQVLSVKGGVSFTLNALTIAHGVGAVSPPPFPSFIGGGAILNNGGTLTISNSTLDNNSATGGGGIYNRGVLTVTSSTFSSNAASSDGSGLDNENSSGTIGISNSTFSNNTGNAISNSRSAMSITNSTFNNNT